MISWIWAPMHNACANTKQPKNVSYGGLCGPADLPDLSSVGSMPLDLISWIFIVPSRISELSWTVFVTGFQTNVTTTNAAVSFCSTAA